MVSIVYIQMEDHGTLKHVLLLVLSIDCIHRLRKASLKDLFSTSRTEQNVLMTIILVDTWIVVSYIIYTNGHACLCLCEMLQLDIQITIMIRFLRGDQS